MITTKGKGYPPAEKDPVAFHGVGPFNPETGDAYPSKGRHLSYTQVFGQTMVRLAREIPCLVGITAAMPQGTGLDAFAKEFPERCYDVGIAEQHGITFSAGLAAEGFIPVVAIYSTFLQRAYDQIVRETRTGFQFPGGQRAAGRSANTQPSRQRRQQTRSAM